MQLQVIVHHALSAIVKYKYMLKEIISICDCIVNHSDDASQPIKRVHSVALCDSSQTVTHRRETQRVTTVGEK